MTDEEYQGFLDFKKRKWEQKHTMPGNPEADKDYQGYLEYKKRKWEQKHQPMTMPADPEDPEADEDYQSYLDFKKQRWEQKHHFDEEPPVMSANPHA